MMAFADLSTCRAIGFATGPIPWTAVDAYAAREGLTGQARQVFVGAIRALDAAYLHDQAAQRAKEPHGG